MYFGMAYHDFCQNWENFHYHLSVYRVRVTVQHILKNNGKTDFSTSNVILEIVGCCGKWQSWIKMPPLVFAKMCHMSTVKLSGTLIKTSYRWPSEFPRGHVIVKRGKTVGLSNCLQQTIISVFENSQFFQKTIFATFDQGKG